MNLAQANAMITKTLNREKLLNLKPTRIGTVNGVRFYEHPIYGDEAPLVMVTKTHCGLTDFWEMSDVHNYLENLGW